jgi:hypothetical protein
LLQLVPALRDGPAALEQDSAQLVDQCRSFTDQPIAGAMQCLHVERACRKVFPRTICKGAALFRT